MNNIEKKLKKRGMQKIDKYAKNPYHVAWFKRIPTWVKIATPSFLTAAAAAVLVIVLTPNMRNGSTNANLSGKPGGYTYQASNMEDAGAKDHIPSNQPQDPSSMYETSIPPWDSLSMPQKYSQVTYLDNKYNIGTANVITHEYPVINNGYILDKLADIQVQNDHYKQTDGQHYQDTASIYKIKNFTENTFIGVKLNGDDNYYLYGRGTNAFDNLGDALNQLSFMEEATFVNVEHSDHHSSKNSIIYNGFDKDAISNVIFNDQTIANETYELQKSMNYRVDHSICMQAAFAALGNTYITLQFYESGYLEFNGAYNVFNLGVARYQALLDYLNNL